MPAARFPRLHFLLSLFFGNSLQVFTPLSNAVSHSNIFSANSSSEYSSHGGGGGGGGEGGGGDGEGGGGEGGGGEGGAARA